MSFSEKSDKRRSTRGLTALSVGTYIVPGPLIGLTAEELKVARSSSFWRPIRYSLFALFWLLWAGFLTGTTLIVVFNNGDLLNTTTAAPLTTNAP